MRVFVDVVLFFLVVLVLLVLFLDGLDFCCVVYLFLREFCGVFVFVFGCKHLKMLYCFCCFFAFLSLLFILLAFSNAFGIMSSGVRSFFIVMGLFFFTCLAGVGVLRVPGPLRYP